MVASIKIVFRKLAGSDAMLHVERAAEHYVNVADRLFTIWSPDDDPPGSIYVSPWAPQTLQGWPESINERRALELNLKVTSHYASSSPFDRYTLDYLAYMGFEEFELEEEEKFPPDPEFVEGDFRTSEQYQQYLVLRQFFIWDSYWQAELKRWESRHQLDQYGWSRLWFDGVLMYVFNMSALAYVISSVCAELPVSLVEPDRGQIDSS